MSEPTPESLLPTDITNLDPRYAHADLHNAANQAVRDLRTSTVTQLMLQAANATMRVAWRIRPKSTDVGRADFARIVTNATFENVVDPVDAVGYNAEVVGGPTFGKVGEPALYRMLEGFYRALNWAGTGIQEDTMEEYTEYRNADRSIIYRPTALTMGRKLLDRWVTHQVDIGTDPSNAKSQWFILGGLGASVTETLMQVTNNLIGLRRTVIVDGVTVNMTSQNGGKNAHLFFLQGQALKWYLANFVGDVNHYLWDAVRGNYHVRYTTGATSALAVTEFQSSVQVKGALNVAQKTPASATATGTVGDIAADANFIYVCTATNTWKRVAVATW